MVRWCGSEEYLFLNGEELYGEKGKRFRRRESFAVGDER